MKTGGHIKPCKVGSVEKHNERDQEYVERMKTSKHPLYFYPSLALRPNQNWKDTEREEYRDKKTRKPLKVAQVFNHMIEVYSKHDKRHRRPPLKETERFDPKTGKMKTIAGWSPIREMVVVIKPETKIEDFDKVKAWFKQNNVNPMFLSLHFDEGHLDEQGNLKANNHAHMGLDFFNWETGKTTKLGPAKMRELQTVLADALGMERGEIKELTGKEHLDVVEQRIDAKKKQLLPKLMTLVGGSDKQALETAQAIIEDNRQEAQRLLAKAKAIHEEAEKKLSDAEKWQTEVNAREMQINATISSALKDKNKIINYLETKIETNYLQHQQEIGTYKDLLENEKKKATEAEEKSKTAYSDGVAEGKRQTVESAKREARQEVAGEIRSMAGFTAIENDSPELVAKRWRVNVDERRKSERQVAELTEKLSKKDEEYNILLKILMSIPIIRAAINAIRWVFDYPHTVTYGLSEDRVQKVNNALSLSDNIEGRRKLGKVIVDIAHQDFKQVPDATTKWIEREVEKVATVTHELLSPEQANKLRR